MPLLILYQTKVAMTTTKGLIYHMVEEEALDAIASTTEQINFIKTIRTLTKVEENVMLE